MLRPARHRVMSLPGGHLSLLPAPFTRMLRCVMDVLACLDDVPDWTGSIGFIPRKGNHCRNA